MLTLILTIMAVANAEEADGFECNDADPNVLCGWLVGNPGDPNMPDPDTVIAALEPSTPIAQWHTVLTLTGAWTIDCPVGEGAQAHIDGQGRLRMRSTLAAETTCELGYVGDLGGNVWGIYVADLGGSF